MKNLSIILLMVSGIFACSPMNSSDLANSNISIIGGDCIFIEDLNTTISGVSKTENLTYDLMTENSMTDNVSGNIYNCRADLLNINQELDQGERYKNHLHNVTVTCKQLQYQVINITAGEQQNISSLNLTINSLYRKNNLNKTMDWSEIYYDSNTNTYLVSKTQPRLNLDLYMNFSETYMNETLNATFHAPTRPIINQSVQLACGENRSFDYSLEVKAPSCINMDKQLVFGETIDLPAYKAKFSAPGKLNLNMDLSDGKNYTDQNYGIAFSCKASLEDKINYCIELNNTPVQTIWEKINTTETIPYDPIVWVTMAKITKYCSLNEIIKGPNQAIECFNSNIDEMHSRITLAEDERKIAIQEYINCNDSLTAVKTSSENATEYMPYGIGLTAFFGALLFAIKYSLEKKAKERALE